MHIVSVTAHPTTADLVVVKTPPAMAAIMGNFEPARRSTELNGYLIAVADLDSFARFLRYHNIAVSDERARPTDTPGRYRAVPFAVLKCGTCQYTQRDCDDQCYHCRTCHNCGDTDLRAHVITAAEQADINARGMAKVAAARATHTPTKETS